MDVKEWMKTESPGTRKDSSVIYPYLEEIKILLENDYKLVQILRYLNQRGIVVSLTNLQVYLGRRGLYTPKNKRGLK